LFKTTEEAEVKNF